MNFSFSKLVKIIFTFLVILIFTFIPKTKNNRTVRINRELTSMHEEVINNLCSIHGALLCMNRSIQAEGTYGIIKNDKSYKRIRRRGLENVILEFTLISCGFNLCNIITKK